MVGGKSCKAVGRLRASNLLHSIVYPMNWVSQPAENPTLTTHRLFVSIMFSWSGGIVRRTYLPFHFGPRLRYSRQPRFHRERQVV